MALRKDLFEGLCRENPEAVRSTVAEHAAILKGILSDEHQSSANKLKAMELRYENMAILSSLSDYERTKTEMESAFELLKKRHEWAMSKLRIYSPEDADAAEKIE